MVMPTHNDNFLNESLRTPPPPPTRPVVVIFGMYICYRDMCMCLDTSMKMLGLILKCV